MIEGDSGWFTEFLRIENPFVEQNDAGAQRDPNPGGPKVRNYELRPLANKNWVGEMLTQHRLKDAVPESPYLPFPHPE